MIDIKKTAATAAAVAVAGVTAVHLFRSRKSAMPSVEEAVKSFYSPEFIAFNLAQDVVSERIMTGYYDDRNDAEIADDYNVIYANFLKK